MLINCPRCGFQQPKDQYCAQCGVDMDAFKPVVPPLWKRVFGNHLVQLGLLLLIASLVGVTLVNRGIQGIADRSSRSTLQISQSEAPSYDTDATSEDMVAIQQDPEAPISEFDALNAQNLNETKDQKRKIAQTLQPTLSVTYAEVSQDFFRRLVEVSRVSGQFMDFQFYSAGIVPALQKRLEAAGANVLILKKEIRPLTEKNLQWFYGLKDQQNPNLEVGLNTYFELSGFDGNSLRGNVRITRNWREANPSGGYQLQRRFFPAIIEIDSGSGFFIAGVMPRHSNLDADDDLTDIDVFKILNSQRFQKGESEFVIFVELMKDSH